MSQRLPSIQELNTLNQAEFSQAIHDLFEPAPPLAAKLYQARPFDSYQSLIEKSAQLCGVALTSETSSVINSELNKDELIRVINAHPRIGETKGLSAASQREQSGGGASEDQDILDSLARLNQEYESLYHFKFVIFVNGRPKSAIVPILQQHLDSIRQIPEQERQAVREAELARGLRDMMLIASDRLRKMQ